MKRPGPRLALLLLVLLDAYLFRLWFLGTFGISDDTAWASALAGAVCIASIGVSAFFFPAWVPLALARGVALVTCGAVAATWLFGTALSHLGSPSSDGQSWLNLVAFGTILLQVGIFVAAHLIDRPGVGATAVSAAVGTVVVYLGGLIVIVVASFGGQVADFAVSAPRFLADSVMQEAVVRVQACALDHVRRYPDRGYPPDLAAMGPAPGTECLARDFASGRKGRVQVTYEPGPRDGTGRVGAYRVVTRADAGDHGEPKMAYGDTAGFLRAGLGSADPATLPVIGGSLRTMHVMRACAEVYRQRHPIEGYPRSPKGFARLQGEVGERDAALVGCNPWLIPVRDSSRFSAGPLRVTYVATQGVDVGPVTDYVIELRPAIYAVHGIRSYRVTARGPVRMTREDRGATEQDAVVPPCEYDLGDFTCAPLPGGLTPAATLDAAESATGGVPFRVAVTDLRTPEQRDAPYQTSIECNSKISRYMDPPPASDTYGFALAWDCAIPPKEYAAWPDRALVRVWVRDRAGSVVLLTDTVRVTGVGVR